MLDKLLSIYNRFQNLEEQLSDPGITNDQKAFRKISKNYSDLQPIVNVYKEYQVVLDRMEEAKEMSTDADADMREMAKAELVQLEAKKTEMEEDIKVLLIPKDPDDDKDVIFEIRAGTGGDEAAIFAGDLYEMYTKYFDQKGWKYEVVEST